MLPLAASLSVKLILSELSRHVDKLWEAIYCAWTRISGMNGGQSLMIPMIFPRASPIASRATFWIQADALGMLGAGSL